MAAASEPDESRVSRAARLLALSATAIVLLLAAGALAVTFLVKVPQPRVTLDLPPMPAVLPARDVVPPPAAAPAAAPPPSIPAAFTRPRFAGHALVADPALIEASSGLPRIAADGRKPMTAYAASARAGRWRIAIVMSGLGLDATATEAAVKELPPQVTLAFSPYAADLQDRIDAARAAGHEVVLDLPMEPGDFPDSDPGPDMLRARPDDPANRDTLHRVLARATGYAGVGNVLGGRFLTDRDALSPVLGDLARRGLYFYDDNTMTVPEAAHTAALSGVPFAGASEALDTIAAATAIDDRLSALEAEARAHGSAIGAALPYPVSVARIARWAKSLTRRGFVLVPVSAIVAVPNNS